MNTNLRGVHRGSLYHSTGVEVTGHLGNQVTLKIDGGVLLYDQVKSRVLEKMNG